MIKIFYQIYYLLKNKIFFTITLILFIASLSGIVFSETKNSIEQIETKYLRNSTTLTKQGNENFLQKLKISAENGDSDALSSLRNFAEQGNSEAQYYLGKYYYEQEDEQEAVKWFTKSAEQGDEYAIQELKILAKPIKHEQRNEKEAFKWYKKAAEQGNKEIFYQLEALASKKNNPALSALKIVAEKGNSAAQLYLGFYYSEQKDKQETLKWYTKSAKQGNDSAQYYLGKYYYKQGNEQEAFKWYKKAVENGKMFAANDLQDLAKEGNSKALSLLKTFAEKGNCDAQYNLGEYYHKLIHKQSYSKNHQKIAKEVHDSTSNDEKNLSLSELKQEALKWYKKAAENGNSSAQYFLWKYYYGQGDEQEASKWYNKAFEQKTSAASSILTALATNGENLSKIKKSADKINSDAWLSILKILAGRYSHRALFEIEKLAEQGNDEAQYFLGKHNYGDQFAPRLDEQKAINWFKKAAEKGNSDAQCWLAHYYKADAVKWYTKAAEQGDESAFSGLQTLAKKGKSEALSVLKSFAEQGNEWAQFYLGDYYYNPKYEEPGFVIY
ncbi:MAG: SEL1-like repeat protein [Elusimicrobia bacterium]|nr:SEL1-like repeat protein [Elusimicrobiota bacterium]